MVDLRLSGNNWQCWVVDNGGGLWGARRFVVKNKGRVGLSVEMRLETLWGRHASQVNLNALLSGLVRCFSVWVP